MIPYGATLKPCYLITHRPHWWSIPKVVNAGQVFWTREDADAAKPEGWRYGVRRFLIDTERIAP